MKAELKHILIARTDGIGDVVLTLPLATALKELLPGVQISFLGRSYTKPVIELCASVDYFLNADDYPTEEGLAGAMRKLQVNAILCVFPEKRVVRAAKQARIPLRVGTGRRVHTFFNLNRRLWFSRKNDFLHETQYNLKMLAGLQLKVDWTIVDIKTKYHLRKPTEFPEAANSFLSGSKKIILHPKSHGSALEWPASKYGELTKLLHARGWKVAISGTQKEYEAMPADFPWHLCHNLMGKLSLPELISVISVSDALVAASTGPLHIGAAFGIHAIGLYSPKRPIFPERWAPIGPKASFLVCEEHPEDGQLPFSAEEVMRALSWS